MFYPDFGKSEKLFGEKKSQLTEIMENFVRDSKKLISILFKRYIQWIGKFRINKMSVTFEITLWKTNWKIYRK